jgi:SAM-dependent methyltransferase
LRDLARVNRYFGGYRILRAALGSLVHSGDPFSVLDVGAASGETGAAIKRWFPQARVCSLDLRPSHLLAAAPPKVCADAFRLPFRPRSFDYVVNSLFLHHFEDHAVVDLLHDFGRVTRRAVLAIDLERGPLAYHFLPATAWLFGWNGMFVHDGLISVQAAFKRAELEVLARRAGLANARVTTQRPWGRLALIAPL